MKNIAKKILVVLMAVLLIGAMAACAPAADSNAKTVSLGTSADYPPFEFIYLDDQGAQQDAGIDVSLANKLAADMGAELNVVNMNFDSLMASLEKGDVDFVIAAVEVTEERLQSADFSDPYYTDLPAMILVKADKAAEYTSLESFAGKSVGAQSGTTKADIVNNEMPGAKFVGLTSVIDLVNELMYDKCDAIVLDGAVALDYAASNSELVVADVALGEALPFCVAVQKGDPKGLLPGINEAIAKINSENKIEEFIALADSLSGVAEEVSADAPAE